MVERLELLEGLASLHAAREGAEMAVQTDEFTDLPLRAQLAGLEDQYARKVAEERAAPARAAEERMSNFKRELEARTEADLEARVRRVREFEVSQVRLEESAR